MAFWDSGLVLTAVLMATLLLGAAVVRRTVPAFNRLGVPDSMLAGVAGLVLGPELLGLMPLNIEALESVVYHGLAVVFIAVSLQTPPQGGKGGGVRSWSFAVPMLAMLQGIVGLASVLVLSQLRGEALHPGFGLMLPLGYGQGPGQALSMGASWEAFGMVDGAKVGLIVAAMGFAWAVIIGVPFVAWGRRRGLVGDWTSERSDSEALAHKELRPPGGLESLSLQVGLVGGVYLITFGLLSGLDQLLVDKPQVMALCWGFHFIIAAAVGLALRPLLARTMSGAVNDALMARLSGLTVDLVTAAALAAVALAVLRNNLVILLAITFLGGLATLLACVWIGRRAFPDAPFEHTVLLYGTATGTLPTGMALLRIVDPELRSPAANSAVVGAMGAIVLASPLLLVLLPYTIGLWPDQVPGGLWVPLLGLVLYELVLLAGWAKFGPLTFERPLTRLWPDD